MTREQASAIRNECQSIADLASARLRDDRVVDANVRHDMGQIVSHADVLMGVLLALESVKDRYEW